MKKKIITLLCIFMCSIAIIWKVNVGAEVITMTSTLSASASDVKAGDPLNISINLSNMIKLSKFKYQIIYDASALAYTSYSMQNEEENEITITNDSANGILQIEFNNVEGTDPLTNRTLLTLKFEVKVTAEQNKKLKFELFGSDYYNENNESITGYCQGTSVNLFIANKEWRLQNISISEGTLSPEFNRDTFEYRATVDSASIVISAIAPEDGSFGSGTDIGTKGLNYGENKFIINSKSQSGISRSYYLYITRIDNRSKDNTLKSITGVSNFNSATTEYNITLPSKESSFTAEAFANDSKASIRYNPSSKRVLLDYGETKKITITVTAENGDKKDYILNITRKDDRNSNNLLQSLTVSGATINFEPNTSSYKVMVDNKYSNVIINAIPQVVTSTVSGIGAKNLNEGTNTFSIAVKAENGSEKIYTLTIVRKDSSGKISDLSNNTNLNYLRFKTLNNDLVTNVDLKQGVYSYEIGLPNSSEMVEIQYQAQDPKAIVSLEGNRDLNVGNNYYRIRVTAENGSTMVYEVTVIRQHIQNFTKNDKESILTALKYNTEDVVTVSVEHNDNNRMLDENIVTALKNSNKTLTMQVLDEKKNLAYSLSLNSSDIENITTLDYRLTDKTENKDQIDTLSNASVTQYLNFEGNKDIPGKIKVSVNVSENFSSENTLTLYYYNKSTETLDLIIDNLKVNKDYVEFELNSMGEYILIDKDLMKMSSEDSTTLLIAGGVILGIVLLIVVIVLIKKKKNKVKIPTTSTLKQETSESKEEIKK